MAIAQLTGGVAVRVSGLCLTASGRVADWSICGPGCVGAAARPARGSLDRWLDERRIGLRDLVEANVASGRWVRHRLRLRPDTYDDRAVERSELDLARHPGGPTDD